MISRTTAPVRREPTGADGRADRLLFRVAIWRVKPLAFRRAFRRIAIRGARRVSPRAHTSYSLHYHFLFIPRKYRHDLGGGTLDEVRVRSWILSDST